MNINPLNIVLRPRKTVQEAQDKPSFKTALLLSVIPAFVIFFGYILFGFPLSLSSFLSLLLGMVRNFLTWIIIAIVFYVSAFLVRGKVMRGSFAGIASSLSLSWVMLSLLTILSFLFYFATPLTFEVAKIAAQEGLPQQSAEELAEIVFSKDAGALEEFIEMHSIERIEELESLVESGVPAFNPGALLAVLVLGAVFFFYGAVIIPFFIVAEVFEVRFLYDFFLWVLLSALSGAVFWLLWAVLPF